LEEGFPPLRRRNILKILSAAGIGMIGKGVQDREIPPPEGQYPRSPRGRELAEIARSIVIMRDMVFARRPERTLRLDVYRPGDKARGPMPAILSIGVAAWKYQRKEFQLNLENLPPEPMPFLYPPCLVQRGYVIVSAECRVSGEATFPAQVHDCKCAIRWMREHARDLGIDPERIGMMGGSASGHLAAMMAVTGPADGLEDDSCYPRQSSHISAAYSYAGLYDFEFYERIPGDETLRTQIREFLGGAYRLIPDVYRRASPVHYVSARTAPLLLMHGRQDRRVPFEQQGHFTRVLKKARVPVEAIEIENYAHSFLPGLSPNPSYIELESRIYHFFDRYMKK